jgi:DNA replication licensing factor MCM2
MSEAWAKMHLRDYVRSDDIDHAIEMLLESFLQSQKVSVARQLTKKFEKYRTRQADSSQLLMHTLKKVIADRVSIIILRFSYFLFFRLNMKKFSRELTALPRST